MIIMIIMIITFDYYYYVIIIIKIPFCISVPLPPHSFNSTVITFGPAT